LVRPRRAAGVATAGILVGLAGRMSNAIAIGVV